MCLSVLVLQTPPQRSNFRRNSMPPLTLIRATMTTLRTQSERLNGRFEYPMPSTRFVRRARPPNSILASLQKHSARCGCHKAGEPFAPSLLGRHGVYLVRIRFASEFWPRSLYNSKTLTSASELIELGDRSSDTPTCHKTQYKGLAIGTILAIDECRAN